jgi:hypothetical protein
MRAYEILPQCVSRRYVGVMLALMGISTGTPAKAVDLVNRDKAPHEVVVNAADGSSKTLTVKAGGKITDVCADCVILVGNSSVETRGRVTVKIEGGEVSIASQR